MTSDLIFKNSVISPQCYRCCKPIKDDSFIMSISRTFHNDCFKCSLCKVSLIANNYILVDRMIFCKTDCIPIGEKISIDSECDNYVCDYLKERPFDSRFLKNCSKCNYPLMNTNYTIYFGLPFHRECLKCNCCDRYLTIDHLVILDFNKQTFCKFPCYERKIIYSKPNNQTDQTTEIQKEAPQN